MNLRKQYKNNILIQVFKEVKNNRHLEAIISEANAL